MPGRFTPNRRIARPLPFTRCEPTTRMESGTWAPGEGYATVSSNAAACLANAVVPAIVIFARVVGADGATVSARIEDSPALTTVGFHDAVTPEGRSVADNLTCVADPTVGDVETLIAADAPGAMTSVRAVVREKFGGSTAKSLYRA